MVNSSMHSPCLSRHARHSLSIHSSGCASLDILFMVKRVTSPPLMVVKRWAITRPKFNQAHITSYHEARTILGFNVWLSTLGSTGEPLLIDVDGINDRTSDASSLSSRRQNFRDNIIGRDGCCVVTGDQDLMVCDACHIIPHAKGDDVRSSTRWKSF